MRYIIADQSNQTIVAIWAKSQNRDEKGEECSHRDYLRKHNISFENIISIGDIHINPESQKIGIMELPWDGPKATKPDENLLNQQGLAYLSANPDIREEIKTDWDNYQAYLKRQQQFLANQR